MPLTVTILSHEASAISVNDAKVVDLDVYATDLSLSEFKSLFYDRDYFYPNDNDANATALSLASHKLNGEKFNLLAEVMKCYENELELEQSCWDPLKKMCLVKDLVGMESLNDFKNCSFKKSLKYTELKKIIDYEKELNSITSFTAVVPLRIISGTQELKDIVFNVRFNIDDLTA
jgi:hypothetical protein